MDNIIQTYLNSVKQLSPKLSDEVLSYMASKTNITELPSKHFYIQAGTIQKELGFIHSGLLRVFYIDHKGNDKTLTFRREKQYVSHYATFGTQKPSKFYFQCIEPSIIINLSYEDIQDCCEKFPEIEHYMRLVIEEAHSNLIDRISGFVFENAETRYINFINENPDLFNRISVSHLCSYLGIERQSLTRIRKKIFNDKNN